MEFKIGVRSYDQVMYAVDLTVTQKANEVRFQVLNLLYDYVPCCALMHYTDTLLTLVSICTCMCIDTLYITNPCVYMYMYVY